MKRILAATLIIIMVVSLCACSGASEWKKFIKEYDAWVDDYIELVQKYSKNPTDPSLLQKYTKMAAEVATWAQKADKISKELQDSPEEAAKFAAELQKISLKLAKAAK